MALNWLWSEKCGEVVERREICKKDEHGNLMTHDFTYNLYQGNAFLIFIHEFTDEDGTDKYNLVDFWGDETHMKRMLGIDKKWKETYGNNIESDCLKFTFYKDKFDNARLKKIVSAIAEAYDNIEIVITNSKDKGGK